MRSREFGDIPPLVFPANCPSVFHQHRVLHRCPPNCLLLGTIIRDTQTRAIKNANKHTNHNHQGFGRKFRLARPLRASDANSDSPDPSGLRTQVLPRPTPQDIGRKFRLARPRPGSDAGPHSAWAARLPPHGARTHDMTDTMASIPRQGKAITIPTTLVTVPLPPSL